LETKDLYVSRDHATLNTFRAKPPLGTHFTLITLHLLLSGLLVFGLLLTGCGGAFLPWIWRDAVALQLTAPGLAEFVKFLPEVRYGQVQLQRLFFLLPLFLAILVLPLLVENKGWFTCRDGCAGVAAGRDPAGAGCPSHRSWTPAILLAPEFRLQTLLTLIAIGLAVIAPVLHRLPYRA
jgi:hypothetical protein